MEHRLQSVIPRGGRTAFSTPAVLIPPDQRSADGNGSIFGDPSNHRPRSTILHRSLQNGSTAPRATSEMTFRSQMAQRKPALINDSAAGMRPAHQLILVRELNKHHP